MLYLFIGQNKDAKQKEAKTLSSQIGQKIHSIDMSTLVSKYIGETEKNLAKLFIKAEKQQWILFFDEADALFGKRSHVKDSHDRYANQEVSYLLKYLERYRGIVILSTNKKPNFSDRLETHFKHIHNFKH